MTVNNVVTTKTVTATNRYAAWPKGASLFDILHPSQSKETPSHEW